MEFVNPQEELTITRVMISFDGAIVCLSDGIKIAIRMPYELARDSILYHYGIPSNNHGVEISYVKIPRKLDIALKLISEDIPVLEVGDLEYPKDRRL